MEERALRVLILEDAPADADLCQRELRRAAIRFAAKRVDTREAFEQALEASPPDLILSDFTMPAGFDGLVALDLARAKSADIPFIFVSGTLGEDRAVEAMRRGATDYVLKDKLNRLVPVVERALRESEERAARRKTERELEETRSRLDSIVSSLPDVVWSYSLQEQRLLYVSPAGSTVFGQPDAGFGEEPAGWMHLVHPEDRERVQRERRASLATRRLDSIYRVVLPGGEVRWIHDRGSVIQDDEGELLRIDGLARDVTEVKLQEQRIARLSRIQAVLTGINSAQLRIRDRRLLFDEACRIAVDDGGFEMAWIGAPDPETSGLYPVACAGVEAQSFLSRARSAARDDTGLVTGVVGRAVAEKRPVYCNDLLAEPEAAGDSAQEAIRRGCRSIIALPLLVEDSVVGSMGLYAREPGFFHDDEINLLTELADDISFALDHIGKGEKLSYLAYYDVLTGLPNRTLFQDRLEQRVSAARRDGNVFSVMMLDIERFRHINDTLGRQAGDELLRAFASRLKATLGETDVLAHVGGDYFTIAVHGIEDTGEVVHLLGLVLGALSGRAYVLGGSDLRIAARAGVALYPSDGADAESLLKNAEAALKDAKRTGNQYLFYAPQMNARVAEQLKLENDLRRAVLEEQFVLYYQPRVELSGGRVCGFEALIRWRHPERGLVAPGEFISVLEATGMILEVGRWALKRAAQDHAAWRAAGLAVPRIAVNVSAVQLRRREFVEEVRAALADTGGFGHIDIEITESMLMEDIEGSIGKLKALQQMGVNVAMDDFGAGYCSLSYLARLPINSLKVDRSFIAPMAQGAEQIAIVSTIVSLAHALSLKVCAEGVETQEQASLLCLLKSDEVQGYLYARPEPFEQAAARMH